MLNKLSINAIVFSLVVSLSGPISAFAASPVAVNLGSAGNFVILAKTGISTTGSTAITGDLGLSPAAASYITGFALELPAASAFSTSALVNGKVYAPGYADPTPANLTTAVLNMEAAYTDAAGRVPDIVGLGAGNIDGLTITPGVYKWSTGVTIPTDVHLSGGANDVWIFQIAQNLSVSSGVQVILDGGARANNIFWVVAGQTTLGTNSVFNGNILDQTTIVLNTGARLNGRALAQAAVTLDANTIIVPTSSTPTSATPATPAVSATPAVPATASAPTTPAIPATPATPATPAANPVLQNQLSGLLETLRTLQEQARQRGSSVSAPAPASAFGQQVRAIANDLGLGSRNNNVSVLQQFLISQARGSAAQALAKNGATTYFGSMTRAALAEFQRSVGITPASGYFGPKTRAYINSLSQ